MTNLIAKLTQALNQVVSVLSNVFWSATARVTKADKAQVARTLRGRQANSFAAKDHTHDAVRKNCPVSSTARLKDRGGDVFAQVGHTHPYVTSNELRQFSKQRALRYVPFAKPTSSSFDGTAPYSINRNQWAVATQQGNGILTFTFEPTDTSGKQVTLQVAAAAGFTAGIRFIGENGSFNVEIYATGPNATVVLSD